MIAQEMAISNEVGLTKTWQQKISRWIAVGSTVWLVVATLLTAALLWTSYLTCPWMVAIYLGATVLLSAISFAMYGLDKRRAKLDKWRISESKLQWLAVLGGWPGSLLGQRTFRHKTQKLKFQLVFWVIVLVHSPLVALSLWSIQFGG